MSIIVVGAGPNLGAAATAVLPSMLERGTGSHAVRERGVRVAHTAIGGRIEPGSDREPDDIADA